jgi:hypothetical protein
MNRLLVAVLAVLAFSTIGLAHKKDPVIPEGSKIYVAADGNFSNYVAAAILANKVPLVVTMDQAQADYILAGSAEGSGVSGGATSQTSHSIFGVIHTGHFAGKTDNSAALVLIDVKTQIVVWGGDIGKGRVNEVANRLAKLLKKNLFG